MKDSNKRVNPTAMSGIPKARAHVLPCRNLTKEDLENNRRRQIEIKSIILEEILAQEAKPYAMMTMAGTFKVMVREGFIEEGIRRIKELEETKKDLAEFLHEMTEPELNILAEKLKTSESHIYYTYGQGSL